MAKEKKVFFFSAGVVVFLLYILVAAQPVPPETVLVNNWLKDLESDFNSEEEENDRPGGSFVIPFTLGGRFGYADAGGGLILNKVRDKYISISEKYWSEYDPAPEEIVIQKTAGDGEIRINPAKGYPVFLDGRIFIISKDQCSLSELDEEGHTLWSYDFEAPLTSFDAAGGYVLAGTLDGMVELLNSDGKTVFPSYAPAARITVILGCRISSDGSKLALVAGIDQQRFIFLERYGDSDYRVTYHEFLKGQAFRREVHMAFINNDSTVVFEQEDGLGIFDVKTRTRTTLPLEGTIQALDDTGEDGLLFLVTAAKTGNVRKRLIVLSLPGKVLVNVPFTSENTFLARRGKKLFIGGGMTLASFSLDRM
ncbi:MAG: WD40 repeat domain-containing protein [Treponema sp.]|nr:WD40 repeat domain-containing protein [Treponema sp.]